MTSGFTITIAIDAPDNDAPAALAAAEARIAELEQQLETHHHTEQRSTSHRQTVLIEGLLAAVERGTHPLEHPLDVPPGLAGRVAKALAPAHEAENLRRELQAMRDREREVEELLDHYNAAAATTPAERMRDLIRTTVREAEQQQRELNGMHHRERMVDKVVAAWDNGNLKGYDGTIDPETPAGRVVELLREVCKVRGSRVVEPRGAALDAILANLRTYGLDLVDDDYPAGVAKAVSVALRDRGDALQQLRTIDNALTMYNQDRDPMTMALKHPADTAARVAEALSVGLHERDVILQNAAARLNSAADLAEQAAAVSDANDEADAAAADAFIGALREAARIVLDKTPEADPNVAHIDTVNGRQRPAQAPEGRGPGMGERSDDRPVSAQLRHPLATGDPDEME